MRCPKAAPAKTSAANSKKLGIRFIRVFLNLLEPKRHRFAGVVITCRFSRRRAPRLDATNANSFYRSAALAADTGEPEWSAHSNALGRKFLRLDQFLKCTSAKVEENVP